MNKEQLRILKCFICEKGLAEIWPDCIGQVGGGGEVSLSFNYGSCRWDTICFREPIHEPGFHEHVAAILSGEIPPPFEKKSKSGIIGSIPRKLPADASRAERLATCTHIIGVICDDCFEKKAHLLRGYEQEEEGKKPKLVIE